MRVSVARKGTVDDLKSVPRRTPWPVIVIKELIVIFPSYSNLKEDPSTPNGGEQCVFDCNLIRSSGTPRPANLERYGGR